MLLEDLDSNEYIQTEGIVLSEYKYKETSRIINVYTKDLGKINLFANGALKSGSSMMLSTGQLANSRFTLKKRNKNYIISDSSVISSNIELGKDPQKYLVAKIITEIVEATTVEQYKDEKIYKLLIAAIEGLVDNQNAKTLKLAFIIKYLSFIGYRPGLNIEKNNRDYVFSYSKGKVVQKVDTEYDEVFIDVSMKDIISLNNLLYTKISSLDQVEIYNIDKLDKILTNFLYTATEINNIKSQSIYDKLFK